MDGKILDMECEAYALIIGVSDYQSQDLTVLPGAEIDAIEVGRALKNWGIPEGHITLLLNSDATLSSIEAVFTSLQKKKTPFRFLFYFCGHGFRTQGENPKSFLLLEKSSVNGDIYENAIHLQVLLEKLYQLQAIHTYLFIDACALRLNFIPNPNFEEELQGNYLSSRGFFCLLSSGILPSFEDQEKFGYFTHALLKSISYTRNHSNSPSELFGLIKCEMKKHDLPSPEMYNIGIQEMEFLPKEQVPYVHNDCFVRTAIHSRIQDIMLQNRNMIVNLYGEKGRGKSTFIEQMSSDVYQVFAYIWRQGIYEKLKSLEDRTPYAWVLIHCKQIQIDEKNLHRLEQIKLRYVFVSEHPLSSLITYKGKFEITEIELPLWSFLEVKQFLQNRYCEEDIEFIYLASRGNPGKIQQLLEKLPSKPLSVLISKNVKKAIMALDSAKLYINESLFCKIYQLDPQSLSTLEEFGLIFHEKGCTRFHELLLEIVEKENREEYKGRAYEYWFRQFEELPHNRIAASNFLLCAASFGYKKKHDPILIRAFETLKKSKSIDVEEFKKSSQIFLKASIFSEAAYLLVQILIEKGESTLACELLQLKQIQPKLKIKSQICLSQALWRSGQFEESISIASKLIDQLPLNSEKYFILFHRASAYFFLGKWDMAYADYAFIHRNIENSKSIGLARCMMGTIHGIRGIEVKRSIELIEAGVSLLIKNQDDMGVWLGWNNLGEIFWKIGNFSLARHYLKKALELSKDSNMKLETLRNLLQVEIRDLSPHSKEVGTLLLNIEEVMSQGIEPFESMQLYNTLVTVSILRNDLLYASYYLKKVIPLTSKSEEYHIYTLSNLAILFRSKSQTQKALSFFNRALELAEKGNNDLAIKQIKQDWASLSDSEREAYSEF